MGETIDVANLSSSERPTAGLRFVDRDGLIILQQAWLVETCDARGKVFGQDMDWRDVPLEAE